MRRTSLCHFGTMVRVAIPNMKHPTKKQVTKRTLLKKSSWANASGFNDSRSSLRSPCGPEYDFVTPACRKRRLNGIVGLVGGQIWKYNSPLTKTQEMVFRLMYHLKNYNILKTL